jgi:hypothetical protein
MQHSFRDLHVLLFAKVQVCEARTYSILRRAAQTDDALGAARIRFCRDHSRERHNHLGKIEPKKALPSREWHFLATLGPLEDDATTSQRIAILELILHHLLASYRFLARSARAKGYSRQRRMFDACALQIESDLETLGSHEEHTIHAARAL